MSDRRTSQLGRLLLPLLMLATALGCRDGGGSGPLEGRAQAAVVPAPGPAEAPAAAATLAQDTPPADGPVCPARAPSPTPLPGVRPEYEQLDYWLGRVAADEGDLDEVLLTPDMIANHNEALLGHQDTHPLGLYDLLAPVDVAELQSSVDERLAWMRDQFTQGAYVERDGQPLAPAELARFDRVALPEPLHPELRVALDLVPLRCGPRLQGFFSASLDLRFDRNNCSSAHAQEVVQVLATWPDGLRLARTAYSIGFIAPDAPLSAPIPADEAEAWVRGPFVRLVQAARVTAAEGAAAGADLPLGTRLPLAHRGHGVLFATADGFHRADPLPDEVAPPTTRPLTRRAVLEEAFRYLGAPYGWGGEGGGQDCSRFLLDVFSAFGLQMPRHSAYQADAGVFSIDISGLDNDTERGLLIDAAARRGIVLLHFPGHIMLYLGRNDEGRPMAIHSFAEYLVPCPPGSRPEGTAPETLYTVDRVSISDLELGRGSSRRSFLERITRIVVLGPSPGPELEGIAQLRPAAPVEVPDRRHCDDSQQVALFQFPLSPDSQEPLHVVATSSRDLGPVELTLVGPDDERFTPDPVHLGGPPWSLMATVDAPAPGAWRAVLGDGSRVEACWSFRVYRYPQPRRTAPWFLAHPTGTGSAAAAGPGEAQAAAEPTGPEAPSRSDGGDPTVHLGNSPLLEDENTGELAHPDLGPVWEPRRTWGPAVENLYAAWVESLFSYPVDQDLTWPSLSAVLADRQRNFLFNYLGQREDEQLDEQHHSLVLFMQPDCADLPYLLRAYYAWKMGLPYGFRRCARGYAGHPPGCMEVNSDLIPRAFEDDTAAFAYFANRQVRGAVHSASARTAPQYEFSDYYPVALTREALTPGTVFADPYGHTIVLAQWVSQGISTYGMLLGADAQPDGTVGRRRFWRGSFLFTPDTTDVGSGFKHYRPLVRVDSPGEGTVQAVDNETLADTTRYQPISMQQYQGSVDDFYDTMEALINPRPLDPVGMQSSLVDALQESVIRRVVSIDLGEDYLRSHPGAVIPMPEGYDIFETEGAWEDFSTPSRDMRLLISIDTVMGFPDAVRRRPERYGLSPGAPAEAVATDLESQLDTLLRAHSFTYTRSDGSAWTLTLRDLVDRSAAFEMAYNPMDCVELRWGAPEGSEEASTCQRHAPPDQRQLMAQYRSWFSTRNRPPR